MVRLPMRLGDLGMLTVITDKCVQEYLGRVRKYQERLYWHSIRVMVLTNKMCRKMKMEDEKRRDTLYGAVFHDIGKLSIPIEILEKKGPLDPDERILINLHTILGEEDIPSSISKTARNIIYHHHEKMDGSGYPDGIRDLPIEVSIVSVADIYDAMSSKRSYKEAYPREEVLTYLEDMAEEGKLDREAVRLIREVTERPKAKALVAD